MKTWKLDTKFTIQPKNNQFEKSTISVKVDGKNKTLKSSATQISSVHNHYWHCKHEQTHLVVIQSNKKKERKIRSDL